MSKPIGPNPLNKQDQQLDLSISTESNPQRKKQNKRESYFKPSELTASVIDPLEKGEVSIIPWLLTFISACDDVLTAEYRKIIYDQEQQIADEEDRKGKAVVKEAKKEALKEAEKKHRTTEESKRKIGNMTSRVSRDNTHLRGIGKNQVILQDHTIILDLAGIIKSIISAAAEKNISIGFETNGSTTKTHVNLIDPRAHLRLPSEHVAPARGSSTGESSVERAHVSPIFGGSATSPDSSSGYSPATPNSHPRFDYSSNRPPFQMQPHPPAAIYGTSSTFNTNYYGDPIGGNNLNQFHGASAAINSCSQAPFATANQTPYEDTQAAARPTPTFFEFGTHQQELPPPPLPFFSQPSYGHRTNHFGDMRENPRSLLAQRPHAVSIAMNPLIKQCDHRQQSRKRRDTSSNNSHEGDLMTRTKTRPARLKASSKHQESTKLVPAGALNIPPGARACHGPAEQVDQLIEDHGGTNAMSPFMTTSNQQAQFGSARCGYFDNSNLSGNPIPTDTTSKSSASASNPHVNSFAFDTGQGNNRAAMNDQRQAYQIPVNRTRPSTGYVELDETYRPPQYNNRTNTEELRLLIPAAAASAASTRH